MRIFGILCGLPLLLACKICEASDEVPLKVFSDPKAQYYVLDLKKLKKHFVSITTRREGPSGISFSRREVNCKEMKFRYAADADTMDELATQNFKDSFSELVTDSISDIVSKYACRTLNYAR